MKQSFIGVGAAILTLSSGLAIGHGGGLDKYGCHTNHKTGDYHCHRPGAQLLLPAAERTALTAPSDQLSPQPLHQALPRCHVGPRGGTYTLTASGRKNYGGC